MKLEKKIELQAKIIHDLREENETLTNRVKELQQIVNDNQEIITKAEFYALEHKTLIESMTEARDKYLEAVKEIRNYQKDCKKEINGLLKILLMRDSV